MKKKYMIFLAVLVICAGAVWYMTSRSSKPEGNAVLAYLEKGKRVCGEVSESARQGFSALAEEVWAL